MGWTTAVWDGAAAVWPWHREQSSTPDSGTVGRFCADQLDHFCHTRPTYSQFGRAVEDDPREDGRARRGICGKAHRQGDLAGQFGFVMYVLVTWARR
jgi:hypothetical protein